MFFAPLLPEPLLTLSELAGNPSHDTTLRLCSESLPEVICWAALLAQQLPAA